MGWAMPITFRCNRNGKLYADVKTILHLLIVITKDVCVVYRQPNNGTSTTNISTQVKKNLNLQDRIIDSYNFIR